MELNQNVNVSVILPPLSALMRNSPLVVLIMTHLSCFLVIKDVQHFIQHTVRGKLVKTHILPNALRSVKLIESSKSLCSVWYFLFDSWVSKGLSADAIFNSSMGSPPTGHILSHIDLHSITTTPATVGKIRDEIWAVCLKTYLLSGR